MILIEKSRLNLIGAYGALGLVVLLLQTTLLSGLRLLLVTPVMTVAAVVCVALFEGEVSGGLFGLFLGLALDATVSANTGASALTLMLVGALAGLVSRLFMLPGFCRADRRRSFAAPAGHGRSRGVFPRGRILHHNSPCLFVLSAAILLYRPPHEPLLWRRSVYGVTAS